MLITSSLDPVLADPELFVDREEFRQYLYEVLQDALLSERRQARFVIYGEKGVGKTILTRWVLQRLKAELGDGFYLVQVEGRGANPLDFLRELASKLVAAGLSAPHVTPDRRRTLHMLGALATNEQITEALTDSVVRTHGGQVGVDLPILGGLVARGAATWTDARQVGQAITRSMRVDVALLRSAILETLARLRSDGIPVVVFFNDLDQAVGRANAEEVRQILGGLVAVEDCIQVVNIRTEVLYDDLRRESELLGLDPLPVEALLDLYRRRVETEASEAKRSRLLLPEVLSNADRLARVNGNAFAFLTWMRDLCRLPGDGAGNLNEDAVLDMLTGRTLPPAEIELMRRAAARLDRAGPDQRWITRDALETPDGDVGALAAADVDRLVQRGLLVVEDLFAANLRVGLEPMMDLFRPSVRARLRTG